MKIYYLILISIFYCVSSLKAQVDSSYLKYGRIPNHDTVMHFVDGSIMKVEFKNRAQTISKYDSSGKLRALDIYTKREIISYKFDCNGILISSLVVRGKTEISTDYGQYGQPICVVISRRKKYIKSNIVFRDSNASDEDYDKVSRLKNCVKTGAIKTERID